MRTYTIHNKEPGSGSEFRIQICVQHGFNICDIRIRDTGLSWDILMYVWDYKKPRKTWNALVAKLKTFFLYQLQNYLMKIRVFFLINFAIIVIYSSCLVPRSLQLHYKTKNLNTKKFVYYNKRCFLLHIPGKIKEEVTNCKAWELTKKYQDDCHFKAGRFLWLVFVY